MPGNTRKEQWSNNQNKQSNSMNNNNTRLQSIQNIDTSIPKKVDKTAKNESNAHTIQTQKTVSERIQNYREKASVKKNNYVVNLDDSGTISSTAREAVKNISSQLIIKDTLSKSIHNLLASQANEKPKAKTNKLPRNIDLPEEEKSNAYGNDHLRDMRKSQVRPNQAGQQNSTQKRGQKFKEEEPEFKNTREQLNLFQMAGQAIQIKMNPKLQLEPIKRYI